MMQDDYFLKSNFTRSVCNRLWDSTTSCRRHPTLLKDEAEEIAHAVSKLRRIYKPNGLVIMQYAIPSRFNSFTTPESCYPRSAGM
jgi:hypothetical protein